MKVAEVIKPVMPADPGTAVVRLPNPEPQRVAVSGIAGSKTAEAPMNPVGPPSQARPNPGLQGAAGSGDRRLKNLRVPSNPAALPPKTARPPPSWRRSSANWMPPTFIYRATPRLSEGGPEIGKRREGRFEVAD